MEKALLKVKRFKQRGSECAVASASSIANFFNPNILYKEVRKKIKCHDGLYTSEQATLLNQLGFDKVTIVTADMNIVDFSWKDLPKHDLISKLREIRKYYKNKGIIDISNYVNGLLNWLNDKRYNNNLIIDYAFPKYIKRSIDRGVPACLSFAWTSMFKASKSTPRSLRGDICGEVEYHSVVVRGYDDKNVYIVDSNATVYKQEKFRKGFYEISWDKLLVNMSACGDVVLVDNSNVVQKNKSN